MPNRKEGWIIYNGNPFYWIEGLQTSCPNPQSTTDDNSTQSEDMDTDSLFEASVDKDLAHCIMQLTLRQKREILSSVLKMTKENTRKFLSQQTKGEK